MGGERGKQAWQIFERRRQHGDDLAIETDIGGTQSGGLRRRQGRRCDERVSRRQPQEGKTVAAGDSGRQSILAARPEAGKTVDDGGRARLFPAAKFG